MSNYRTGQVISSESQTAYERWEAPHVKNLREQKAEQASQITASQLEDLQKQAYDEGIQLGKKEGHAEGLILGKAEGIKKGQEVVSQVVKRFEQMMQLLADPLEQVDEQVEEELLTLSIAIAKQIIRREITANPEHIVAVVKEAINVLPSSSKKIKVYLNPADAEIIRKTLNLSSTETTNNEKPDQLNAARDDDSWSIVDKATINRGGCHIKTENSQIDATIDTRVAEIAVKIFGDERALDKRTLNEKEGSASTEVLPEIEDAAETFSEKKATESVDLLIDTQEISHDD